MCITSQNLKPKKGSDRSSSSYPPGPCPRLPPRATADEEPEHRVLPMQVPPDLSAKAYDRAEMCGSLAVVHLMSQGQTSLSMLPPCQDPREVT